MGYYFVDFRPITACDYFWVTPRDFDYVSNESFPDSAKAIGQSSYTVASYGIGGSLGGVFSGLIWEEFFPESIYIFASLVAFLGAVVAWLLIRKYKVECD